MLQIPQPILIDKLEIQYQKIFSKRLKYVPYSLSPSLSSPSNYASFTQRFVFDHAFHLSFKVKESTNINGSALTQLSTSFHPRPFSIDLISSNEFCFNGKKEYPNISRSKIAKVFKSSTYTVVILNQSESLYFHSSSPQTISLLYHLFSFIKYITPPPIQFIQTNSSSLTIQELPTFICPLSSCAVCSSDSLQKSSSENKLSLFSLLKPSIRPSLPSSLSSPSSSSPSSSLLPKKSLSSTSYPFLSSSTSAQSLNSNPSIQTSSNTTKTVIDGHPFSNQDKDNVDSSSSSSSSSSSVTPMTDSTLSKKRPNPSTSNEKLTVNKTFKPNPSTSKRSFFSCVEIPVSSFPFRIKSSSLSSSSSSSSSLNSSGSIVSSTWKPLPLPPSSSSSSTSSPSTPKLKSTRGFKNKGNTCYQNAVLISLLSLPPFIHFFSDHPKIQGPLIDALKKLIHQRHPKLYLCSSSSSSSTDPFFTLPPALTESSSISSESLDSTDLQKAMESYLPSSFNFQSGDQEDAHEFLLAFLDTLESESILPLRLFETQVKITLTCTTCSFTSSLLETYRSWSLPTATTLMTSTMDSTASSSSSTSTSTSTSNTISTTTTTTTTTSPPIVDLSKCLSRSEFVEYSCTPFQHAQAHLIQHVHQCSKILVFHVKRFEWTPSPHRIEKLTHSMWFPFHVSFPLFSSLSSTSSPFQKKVHYQAWALISHIGTSSEYGHYVADIYDPSCFSTKSEDMDRSVKCKETIGGWVEYNDDLDVIQRASWEEVMRLRQEQVYLVFYLQIEEDQVSFPSPLHSSASSHTNQRKTTNLTEKEDDDKDDDEVNGKMEKRNQPKNTNKRK